MTRETAGRTVCPPHNLCMGKLACARYDDHVIVGNKHDVASLLIHCRPISKRDLKTVKKRSLFYYINACVRYMSQNFFISKSLLFSGI